MPYYMYEAAYTNEAWAGQTTNPQNVVDRIRPFIENLGGNIISAFYAFGEYDFILIAEFPDNVSVVAGAIASAAGGAVRASRTTPLMTIEEGMEAMKKAGGAGYRPPNA